MGTRNETSEDTAKTTTNKPKIQVNSTAPNEITNRQSSEIESVSDELDPGTRADYATGIIQTQSFQINREKINIIIDSRINIVRRREKKEKEKEKKKKKRKKEKHLTTVSSAVVMATGVFQMKSFLGKTSSIFYVLAVANL